MLDFRDRDTRLVVGGLVLVCVVLVGFLGFQMGVNWNPLSNNSSVSKSINPSGGSSGGSGNPSTVSGRTVCPDCGGTGIKTCQYCSGSGVIACPECGGSGTIIEGGDMAFICPSCGGNGVVDCPGGQAGCDGGTYRCPKCNGDGFLDPGDGTMM